MEVEEERGEEAECVTFLSRKSKLGMNEVALFEYFNTQLEETTECHNKWCTCLVILADASSRASIAKYFIPIENHSDVMYAEPSEEVWSKVKVEKTERSEFRANLKAKKYAGKEQIESMTFGDGEAKM